ncbi:MAG: hypothetical protein ACYCU8_05830 [Ferrimicrobium acidiphilum]
MADMPNFRVDDLGSLVEELYRFYQALGYPVAIAYVREHGLCACGDTACTLDPHVVTDNPREGARRSGASDEESYPLIRGRLVMQTSFTVATEDTRVLGHIKDPVSVPMLRHGSTSYLFVRDVASVADLFPILGRPTTAWLSLPPYRSDSPTGGCDLPSWLAPLSVPPDQLPLVTDLFGSSVFSRIAQLQQVGVEVQQRTGEGVLSLDQIVTYAVSDLRANGQSEDTLALLAVATIGGLLGISQAYRLLENDMDALRTLLLETLFTDGDIDTNELVELLYRSAVSMIQDGEGIDSDFDNDDDDSADEDREPDDSVRAHLVATVGTLNEEEGSESVAIEAENYLDELIESERWDIPELGDLPTGIEDSDALDWEQILDGIDSSTLTPLKLVGTALDKLGLERDPLTSLALLDMVLTAISEPPAHPAELFDYLWPTRETFLDELKFHTIVVQLLAGILIRFDMMCDAGLLMSDVTFLDQLLGLDTPSLVSDLFGAPDIIFWLQKHVLSAPLAQLDTRIHKIAHVLETIGTQIVPNVSTAYYLDLIGERLYD